MVSGTHTIPGFLWDSFGNGMGIVWEAYHKGVPLLGVPGISLDLYLEDRPKEDTWLITMVLVFVP